MLDHQTWWIFITACTALAFSPGPGMMYVFSRAMEAGVKAGVASTLGTLVGGFVHVLAAAVGVSAVLIGTPEIFILIKIIGAVYLIYLGLRMLEFKSACLVENSAINVVKVDGIKPIFFQGITTELLNPKTAIFFLAFVPQFINTESGSLFFQFIVLGTIVVLMNTVPDFIISFFSGPVIKYWLKNESIKKIQKNISGGILIILAFYLIFY